MSLLIPVTIDCIVDGFLLGITSAVSFRAGLILSVANAIEMGFLGLAVSIRIQKCTGSTLFVRYLSIILPPCIMFVSSLLSTYSGYSLKNNAVLYKLFISFGIVALLSLVINELLVEAREITANKSQDNQTWYSGMIIFLGIYAVLLMDMILPA
jgi:ZIP family zinc transporter